MKEKTFKFRIKKNLPLLKIRKKGKLKNIFGIIKRFEITKVIPVLQSNIHKKMNGKVYVLEKLKDEDGKKHFRLGYYIIGQKSKMKGKWVWGQYCPMGPVKDFKRIIKKAESKGFFE